jgi:hypothetical protein
MRSVNLTRYPSSTGRAGFVRQLREKAFKVLEFNLRTVPKILRAVFDEHDPAERKGEVQAKPGDQPYEHAGNMSRLPCVRNLQGSERVDNVFRPTDKELSF